MENKDNVEALKQKIETLETQLAFVMSYLDPKDTSFRQMIDIFCSMPARKKAKLADLSMSLADISKEYEP